MGVVTAAPQPPWECRLIVDSSYHPVAYKYGYGKVRVTIDSYEYLVDWGPAAFDIPVGPHELQVRASQPNFGRTAVRTSVQLHQGQQLTLHYRALASLFHHATTHPRHHRTARGRPG
jgi:hypothetical protein